MNREMIKSLIAQYKDVLYGMDGKAEITVEEINSVDRILTDMFKKKIRYVPECTYTMSEEQRKKISKANKGKKLSDEAKERQRENSQRIEVYQMDLDGNLIGIWKSTREAGRAGYSSSLISKCCRGVKRTAYGCTWSYKPINEPPQSIKVNVCQVVDSKRIS